ncbi:hypothetical protein KIPB_002428 [Kipferlia bialata]|uniref:Uncharacterized protein n=1 Tax=Kipferlia bialata TaxID=797122 RepID=A0A9K3CQH6_9EUKA|nr:hypothetical protein KIPB_002428 [Kipferlia bialata]|eukprot:g2428.t1
MPGITLRPITLSPPAKHNGFGNLVSLGDSKAMLVYYSKSDRQENTVECLMLQVCSDGTHTQERVEWPDDYRPFSTFAVAVGENEVWIFTSECMEGAVVQCTSIYAYTVDTGVWRVLPWQDEWPKVRECRMHFNLGSKIYFGGDLNDDGEEYYFYSLDTMTMGWEVMEDMPENVGYDLKKVY